MIIKMIPTITTTVHTRPKILYQFRETPQWVPVAWLQARDRTRTKGNKNKTNKESFEEAACELSYLRTRTVWGSRGGGSQIKKQKTKQKEENDNINKRVCHPAKSKNALAPTRHSLPKQGNQVIDFILRACVCLR